MKRASKKLISLLLALCMLAGMIPMYAVTTSAATTTVGTWEQLQSAVNSAGNGDTIYLSDTVRTNNHNSITLSGKSITIESVSGKKYIKRTNQKGDTSCQTTALFTINSGATLTLKNVVVYDDEQGRNYAIPGFKVRGTLVIGANAEVTNFYNNGGYGLANENGAGAIHVFSGGTLTLDGGTISNNKSYGLGGAIRNEGTVRVNSGTITNCGAIGSTDGYKKGGAIYNNGTVYMSGGSITNCTAYEDGGAIYNAGNVTISGGTFSGNTANGTTGGGAILNLGTLTVTGGTFSGNKATAAHGGAIYTTGTFSTSGARYEQNEASAQGGAIIVTDGTAQVTGGFFTSNKANHGAAISRAGGNLHITGTGFSWNVATSQGDDLFTNVYGSTSCGVTFSAYSFNTHQNRGYCVYYDRPNGDADNRDYFITSRVGTDYPPNAGGYKFLPVTLIDLSGTVQSTEYSISLSPTENGAAHAILNGFSTTVGGYSGYEKLHLLETTPKFPSTLSTTYGTVTVDTTNNKIVYTLKPEYQHRVNDITDTFYYDAKTPIVNGDNGHSGYALVTISVKGKGHTFTNNTQTIAPTCKTDGYTKHTCSNCSYTYNDNVIKASAAYHNWTNETVTKQPTCQPGEKTFTCSYCGQTKKETIAANGTHNFTNAAIKQVDKDNHAKQCTICKDWVNEVHTWATTSYTTEGITVTVKTCNICGYVSRTYSGASVPTMIVGQGTTTANSTVTIPVRLLAPNNIWAQNFIIYYPENLELTNVSSSTDLYPDTGVISTKEIDATANARVTNAMLEANVSPAGMKALIYYVDKSAIEGVKKDGDIVYLTFKIPATALSSYNIGIVGVDDDAVDFNGNDIDMTYINGKINVSNPSSCAHSTKTVIDEKAATCIADGYRAEKCSTCGNIITSTVTPKNENHNYSAGQTYPATCTEAGYTVKTCALCGKVSKVTDTSKPATGHNLGTETIIKQPTGMSAGINRQQCSKCDYYKDTAFETAKNTGTSIGDGLTYQYKLVSEIKPGHDYVISNKNTAGSAVVMSAKSGDSSIQNADATITGNTIVVDDTAAVWTATSSSEGVYLTNKATGQYLSGFQNTRNTLYTHLNIGVSDDPFTDPNTFLFNANSTSNLNRSGFYLGWEDYVTEYVYAVPSNTYLQAASWTAFTSSNIEDQSHFKVYLDKNFEIEFDAAFGSEDSRLRMFRPIANIAEQKENGDYNNGKNDKDPASGYSWNKFCIEITPSTVMLAGADFENQQRYFPQGYNDGNGWSEYYGSTTGNYTAVTHFNYDEWNHYKIVVNGATATAYVNGKQVVSVALPDNFGIADTAQNYDVKKSAGLVLLDYHYWPEYSINQANQGSVEAAMAHSDVGIDNMKITTHNNDTSDTVNGSTIGGNETLQFFWDFENATGNVITGMDVYGSYSIETKDVSDGYIIGNEVVYAKDKFIASSDSENKVYFYEKQEVGSAAEVYQRASELVPGEKYVIVSDNLEGTGKSFISNSGGAVGGKTVYSDAISYDPYVTLADASGYEFVFAGSADRGYLVNAASGGKYLKADGTVTATATADNIIDVTKNANGNMVIKIGGTNYYLYKRVVINKIDTDLVNDISVVDFGWGFVLDGDSDLRNNDSWNGKWTDKTTAKMTLSSLATGVSGTKNNHFYKSAKGTDRAASLTNTNYTASVGSNKITYSPKGKYETEQTFTYEFTITNIASYIYGDVTVIPATTVYYEETANMFTYNGTWSTVGSTKDTVGLLLDKHYGKSDTYANDATFSAGGAKYAKVTNGDNTKWVSFKFKGTGFELFSATSGATGPVFVTVTGPNNYAKYIFVDTNFGYTYDQENDKWVSNGYTSGTMGQYQVPVVKLMDLTYGEYNVLVEPSYDAMTDHANLGYSDFYFDGVRIFDPLGTSLSLTAKAAYKADKEYAPKVISLRQYLASGSNMALYLDGKTLSGEKDVIASDYKSLGANNEVQLGSMGTVAFNVKTSGTAPAKVSIGIKLASGTTGKVTVKGGNVTKEITVNSATDMYYDITDVYNALGNGTMIVTNSDTGAVVSLTTLKYSYDTEPTSTSSLALYSNSRTVKNANRMMRAVYNVKDETFTAGDVNSDGKINAMDVLTLKRYLAGYIELSETELKAADVNGDGKVNSRDILALKAMM